MRQKISLIHSCSGSLTPAWDVFGRMVGLHVWGVAVTWELRGLRGLNAEFLG